MLHLISGLHAHRFQLQNEPNIDVFGQDTAEIYFFSAYNKIDLAFLTAFIYSNLP